MSSQILVRHTLRRYVAYPCDTPFDKRRFCNCFDTSISNTGTHVLYTWNICTARMYVRVHTYIWRPVQIQPPPYQQQVNAALHNTISRIDFTWLSWVIPMSVFVVRSVLTLIGVCVCACVWMFRTSSLQITMYYVVSRSVARTPPSLAARSMSMARAAAPSIELFMLYAIGAALVLSLLTHDYTTWYNACWCSQPRLVYHSHSWFRACPWFQLPCVEQSSGQLGFSEGRCLSWTNSFLWPIAGLFVINKVFNRV